jgi:7-cyano-7-deazaguanine synthase in queuosine biosynthesis|tara:strand:+ start:3273 stop:4058 length:786 start_codon:yes stop_codon:yes gene_type:complete
MIIEDTAIIYKRGNDCAEVHPEEYKIALNLNHTNIGIGMSGGLDSSMLLWLLAHHIDENDLDITIHQWTCIHEEKPWQHIHAAKAIDFVKQAFPNVKFGEHMIRMTNAKDYIDNGTKTSWNLVDKHNITALFNGVTVNPTDEIGEPVWKERWKRRATTRDWENRQWWIDNRSADVCTKHTEYLPFIHSDKRVILAFYKKYGLYASLGALTRSCEGWIEETNHFTTECKGCWWCVEKEWATAEIFNYDAIEAVSTWTELDID